MLLRDHTEASGSPLLPRIKRLVPRDLVTSDIGPMLAHPSPSLRSLPVSFERGMTEPHPASTIPIFAKTLDAIAALSPFLRLDHAFHPSASGAFAFRQLGKLTKLHLCPCSLCAISDLRAFWTTVVLLFLPSYFCSLPSRSSALSKRSMAGRRGIESHAVSRSGFKFT